MHILLISRCPPYPLYFGDRLIVWHLVRELTARGHTIDLLAYTQRPEDSDPDEQAQYRGYFRDMTLLPEPQRPLLSIFRRILQPSRRFPRNAREAWSPEMWLAIAAQRRKRDYDLAHCFGGVQVYELAYVLEGLPRLITPYESYSLYLKRQIARSGGIGARLRLWAAQQYEGWMFNPYQQTVVVAEPDRDELLSINPALGVRVIPNGIDISELDPPSTAREPDTLLFTGNFDYGPNMEAARYLIETVLPTVRRQRPQARLILAGANPPPELQAMASDYVEITGMVPELKPYQARAALFVCPLLSGAGIKNKVLAALAMGMPVVATPISVDGIAVQHGHNAWICPAEQMANSVLHLLADDALRAQLSVNGPRLIAERYSWAQVVSQYEALYKELLTPENQD